MVRPLFVFHHPNASCDLMSDGELEIFDQAPTDDFEGVTDWELNHISWTGPNPRRFLFGLLTVDWGPPSVVDEHYEAFDLDGQLLDLAPAPADAREQHGIPVEWVLVATGRFDLPRLHELATGYAASFGVELPDEEPLLFLANVDEDRWSEVRLSDRRPRPPATPELVEMYRTDRYTRS